jgi:hypothetical protein
VEDPSERRITKNEKTRVIVEGRNFAKKFYKVWKVKIEFLISVFHNYFNLSAFSPFIGDMFMDFPKATAFHLTILDCVIGRVILISLHYYFYFIIMFACGFVSKPCLNICATFSLDSTLFWQKNVQVF